MNSRLIFGAMAIMACLIPSSVFGQASINENQTTSIYVDANSGSDSYVGTSAKPLGTIQTAVNKAVALGNTGIGAKVIINPGVYREALTISYHGSAPLTVQASSTGATTLDGADVLTNWHSEGNGIYGYTWKDTVTGCPLPPHWYTGMPPVVLANEMVFVNGKHMTQVMSSAQLRPGTFYVAPSTEQLLVDPPSGTDMATAKVEVAARRATLTVNGSSNLVFRGLVFQHAASCINETGATVYGSSNVLFDSDVANWNNYGALGVNSSTHVTVENTTASYNGGAGLSGFEDVDSTWENNETDYNNWRGAQVGLYDFAQGGTKLGRAHTATVSGQKSYNNQSQGLWFDTDNMNITISNATLVGNIVDNLQLEASQGPFTISNSIFCSGGAGLNLINAGSVSLTGSHFYNNQGVKSQNAQIYLSGVPGGREVTNWQTGATTLVFTNHTKLAYNSFIAVGSNQHVFDTYVSGTSWSGASWSYIDTLTSNYNHWYNTSLSSNFGIPAGKTTTFPGWKSLSHQDAASTWALPTSASAGCGVPTTSYPDFQIMAHNAASYVSGYTMSGGTITIPIQVKNFNYGTVTLSASGLPSGVTASFKNSSLSSGNTTMTLHASTSAAYQTVPITIFGVSGSRVHTITVKVSVRPS